MKLAKCLLAALLLFSVSCHQNKGSGVSVVGDDLAKADVRRLDAIRHLTAAKPGCNAVAAVHVQSAAQDLTDQGGDLKQAKTDLATVQSNYDKIKGEYDKLSSNGWVKAALFLQKLFYWVLGIGVGLLLAATAAIVFLPAGSAISMALIRLLPMMNFATWLRNWYQEVKMVPQSAPAQKILPPAPVAA